MSLVEDIVRKLENLTDRIVNLEVHEQPAVYAARVYKAAAQTIADSTTTAIIFDTERYDYGAIHDNVTNNTRLTAPADGIYAIVGNVVWAANDTGERRLMIRLGGATPIAATRVNTPHATRAEWMVVSTQYELDKDQYVELTVYQTSTGDLDINTLANYSPEFMMARVA